eukprot:1008753-Prymnesium_polylepis.1
MSVLAAERQIVAPGRRGGGRTSLCVGGFRPTGPGPGSRACGSRFGSDRAQRGRGRMCGGGTGEDV